MDLKIIHVVIGKANPNKMNGINKVVNSLGNYQSTDRTKVEIWGITNHPNHNYPKRNYKTRLFQKQRNPFSLDQAIYYMINYQQSTNTIFHFHGGFVPEFFSMAKYLLKNRFQYTITLHGSYNMETIKDRLIKKSLYHLAFDRFVIKNAKFVHFIGKSEVEFARKYLPISKARLIPNGQNIEEVKHEFNSINTSDKTIVTYCGRFDIVTKGLDLLITSFGQVQNASKNMELWLIGDGTEREALKAQVRSLGLDNNVRFWGAKYGEEKFNILAQSDVLALLSRNEGLPGVVLEAAALGVPSIVSQETNMGEYLTSFKAGITLNQRKTCCVTEAIGKVVYWKTENKLMEIQENAKKMVNDCFNWTKISENLIHAYEA